jgi:hypothetical protein
VADQVVTADPALDHSGFLVARVLVSHCDRLLRDLVHDQVSEGLVRLQCRGDSVVVAGELLRLCGAGYRPVSAVHSLRCPRLPRRLELEYPQQLNRWLPLVKWLLAFPQYLIVGALVGSGDVVATSRQDGRAVSYSTPSLIGACVLIAAIALLFTTHYPPGLFDLALGIDRWGYRLLVCVALMTDRYPPFRLDQGSIDIEGPPQSPPEASDQDESQPEPRDIEKPEGRKKAVAGVEIGMMPEGQGSTFEPEEDREPQS